MCEYTCGMNTQVWACVRCECVGVDSGAPCMSVNH